MDISTPEVEKNISFFLSPSAANICMVCHVDISAKYPNNLNCRKEVRKPEHAGIWKHIFERKL